MASSGQPVSYRSNVNRAITKRWAEAKQISYEGNDWGDEDDDYYEPTPTSARSGQQSQYSAGPSSVSSARRYPPPVQSNVGPRSVANPSPTRSMGRSSFDRGDEQRNLAQMPTRNFEGPYPSAQPAPFPEPQHEFEHPQYERQARPLYGYPPLHVETGSRPSSRDQTYGKGQPFIGDTRGPYRDPRDSPSFLGTEETGRRSQSSGRPSQADMLGRADSPYRTVNHPPPARSQASRDASPTKRFPPRKSSMGQDAPVYNPPPQPEPEIAPTSSAAHESTTDAKPLPFIRPADIYKRVAEEREKERRSQDSARPSIDSNASRPRDVFTSARQSQDDIRPIIDAASGGSRDSNAITPGNSSRLNGSGPQPTGIFAPSTSEENDPTPRQKPALDPVAERKSEYGFDEMLKGAGPEHPSVTPATSTTRPQQEPLSATSMTSVADPTTAVSDTSNYSNRPDPITASSVDSHQSIPHFLPAFRGVSDFGADFINRGTPQSPNEVRPSYLPAKPQDRSVESPTRPQQPPPSFSGQDRSMSVPDSAVASNDQAGVSVPLASEEAGNGPESLQHNPSTGLRSVVHQAFDNSQSQVPPTPSSVGDSLNRSNSASASDISPIITRDAETTLGARPAPASSFVPIAEEPRPVSRPGSSSVAETSDMRDVSHDTGEAPLPAPSPPFKPGYRRDSRTPSPGNSPARKAMTVESADIPKAALATISTGTPKVTSKPWDTPSSTTDDWRDWEAQRRAFNAKAGFNDSTPTTPALTPGPRNDSPGKGMLGARQDSPSRGLVRDMADKLESRSGRASPATSTDPSPDTPRPSNARLESFRPTLPGGWQSYTTNTDALTPRQDFAAQPISAERDTATSQPPVMTPHDFSVPAQQGNDEEGPRAGPPRFRREESDYGPSQTAFAAAAAAGSALLGAFGGTTNSSHRQGESEGSHDVSEDESAPTPSIGPENVATRDFGNSHDKGPLAPALAGLAGDRDAVDSPHESHGQGPIAPALASLAEDDHPANPAPATQIDETHGLGGTSHQHEGALAPAMADLDEEHHDTSQFAPTPPAKDTPDETETDAPASTLGYFPPPLRTSRTNELSSTTRPPMLPVLSTGMSPQDTENDRLRKEIVKSLTPKTSRQEELYSDEPLRSNEPLPQSTEGRLDQGDGAELSSTDVLEEYLPPDDEKHSVAAQKVSEPQHRPVLEQKFSWERSEVASPQDPQSAQSPSANQVISGLPNTVRPTSQSSPPSAREQPRSLSPEAAPSVTTPDAIRRVQNDPSEDTAPLENSYTNSNGLGLRTTPSRDGREMPFREILAMGSAQDRIQAYNSHRVLLANQDNGLRTWMQSMGEQTPEHTNILRSNGRMTAHEAEALASFKPPPARSKFQRLASLGNTNPSLGNTNQSVDVDHEASPASNRSANPQGKKLLQTAGKFGGQAGVAAKGLFAKGKDKLRSSGGGNDKGILTNRRNSRQLLTPTEERRHSSLTAEPAPQIPNLNISAASPVREDDPWSLSSLVNERTAQQPLEHKQIQQLPLSSSQAGKDSLGQLQGPNEPGVLPARRPSSRVSAVDSARDINVPSRSISEVTRPTNSGDERSPTVARAQDRESGDHGQAALNAAPAPLPPSTSLTPEALDFDALGVVPTAAPDHNQRTATNVPPPTTAERTLLQDQALTPKHSDPRQHQLGALGVVPATTRSIRESMQSGISSPSPGLPSEGAVAALNDVQRRSVSPVQQEPADPPVSDTAPPPFENVAPVYNPKEAEVAAERQQIDPTEEGLPAYPRPSEEQKRAAARQSIDPASVVPVTDPPSQKRNRTEPAESRPFSFVGGETLISPLTKASTDRSAQSPIASSSLPGFDPLQKELSVVSAESSRDSLDLAKRKSKSYSRPFVTDPNVRNHPAFRPSEEIAREEAPQNQEQPVVAQVNDISPEQVQQRKVPTANQPEGYRIPGPHGHQYRSPKQVPLAFAGQAQPRSQSPYNHSGAPGYSSAHPLRSHDPQDVERVQSPAGFGSASPAPQQMLPPADRPEARSMSSLFRSRSKSGSRRGRGEATGDVQYSPKKEKRSGIFRQRTKPDSESLRSSTGSFRQDSYGGRADSPQQDFGARQGPDGEERDHVGNLDNTRPPSQLRNSSSGDILQSDGKKKRFSGFGGFFGRSGSASRDQGKQVESPGDNGVDAYREPKKQKHTEKPIRTSTLSGLLGKSNQARPQQGAVPPQNVISQHGFPPQQVRAPFPPANSMQHPYSAPPQSDYQPTQSFNAPAPFQRGPASAVPHGPDSFARDHYAEEQDFTEQRPMQQNGYIANPQQSQQDTGRQALHIDTGANHAPAHHLVTAPPGPAPAFHSQSPSAAPPSAPPSQPSYFNNQRSQSPYEDTRSRSPYSAKTANIPKSHAIDLHKRSRSPRNGRRNSDDERDEIARANDPANQLGTFSKASAPRSADPNNVEQEKPWEIVLPGSEVEKKRLSDARMLERTGSGPNSATNDAKPPARAGSTQHSATNGTKATQNTTTASEASKEAPRKQPTVAEKLMGVQTPRDREPLKAAENQQRGHGLGGSPVELPGSRAPGDESDEEIVMSSTAYPGQEWMPDNFGYGHWDD